MAQILTLTLNPALDLATEVAAVIPGPKLRCAAPRLDPGGGGVNVSRAIRNLGGDSVALAALGGVAGDAVASLLAAEGVTLARFDAPGDTRQSFAVTDAATGAQYRFMLPGPVWHPADESRLLQRVADLTAPGDLVVLSGSQPPGVAPDFPARLCVALQGRARVVIDTSGAPLRQLIAGRAGPFLLRMDGPEAEDLAGRPLSDRAASLDFAADLVRRGVAEVVIVARGADGSVLAAEGVLLASVPARVRVVSKIGAGDSFVGALVLALSRGDGLAAALQWGTAAAAAAVTSAGTGLCRREDVEHLLGDCRVESV